MNMHVQPISHYPPHERINNSHSNLTEGNAGLTRLEAVPKNDVTYSCCIHKLFNISILSRPSLSPCHPFFCSRPYI